MGLLVHPDMVLLDLVGPQTVFSLLMAKVHLVWKDRAPVTTDVGIAIAPTTTCRLVDRTVSGEFPRLADREGYLLGTAGLLAVWLLFLGAYLLACRVTVWLVRGSTVVGTARLFVLSLVPIAVAYNLAHNSSYVLVQGQALIPLLSDPLGRGWNLFGMAAYSPDLTLVGARFTWYVAVGAIVAGHVIAVWLAYRQTLRAFGARRAAVVASVPLTILMVVYTALSVSVIAEPLVRFRTPDPSYSRLGPAGLTISQEPDAGGVRLASSAR